MRKITAERFEVHVDTVANYVSNVNFTVIELCEYMHEFESASIRVLGSNHEYTKNLNKIKKLILTAANNLQKAVDIVS